MAGTEFQPAPMNDTQRYQAAIAYIRAKVNQLLALMGTLPLRPEELDDATLLDLDPIGIVAGSFAQIIEHLNDTNRRLTLATREIRAILDALDAAVIVVNPDGTLDDCNRKAQVRFFLPGAVLLGRPLLEICQCGGDGLGSMLEKGSGERALHINGRDYLVVASRITDESGALAKIVLMLFDVTRQKATEASLRLYAQVFRHTGEGILITDRDNRIVEVNAAFCRITGYAPDELLGRDPGLLQSGLHDAAFHATLMRELHEKGVWKGEIHSRTRDGMVIPLLYSISVVRDAEGGLTHYIAILTDISHLKEAQSRLDFLAHHDVLTHLPNRLLLMDRLDQAIARAKREHALFGLLFIDLDRFKTINDSLGHHVGDKVLVEVARRLGGLVRRDDTVARLGGDEFVVLMERLNQHAPALRMADRIVAALRQPYLVENRELHLGCSLGITFFPEDGLDASSLLKNADAAMYLAKEAGRDGHARFSHALSDSAIAKLALENALRDAVRRQAFQVHYQPIVDMESGRVCAVEALLRWPDGPAGANSPDRFVPLAEETRLILPLGEWVLRAALEQFRVWRAEGLGLDYVSVNLSAVQLAQPRFPELLESVLDDLAMPGRHLQLELTENLLMGDLEYCRDLLGRLRRRGVRIAIDDFGTGYSSLAYLRQLPIDNLKIDRSFVRDIPGDPNDCAIATAIIGLARTLGLAVIAEGIETEPQEAFLRGIGCHHMQGFRYARPLPEAGFRAWLAAFSGGGAPATYTE